MRIDIPMHAIAAAAALATSFTNGGHTWFDPHNRIFGKGMLPDVDMKKAR